jgi:hypothetical protein
MLWYRPKALVLPLWPKREERVRSFSQAVKEEWLAAANRRRTEFQPRPARDLRSRRGSRPWRLA